MDTLKSLAYRAIHRSKKPAAVIAEEIGVSYSYLCRMGLPTDEGGSGVSIPADKLVPLMRSTGDFGLLRHLNTLCGFLTVKMPRAVASRHDELQTVNEYTEACSKAGKLVLAFFKSPTSEHMTAARAALDHVMELSASLHRTVKNFQQTELDLQ